MEVKQLTGTIRKVDFKFEGADEYVCYRLGAINGKLGKWIDVHKEDREAMAQLTERAVTDWSLTDGGEKVLPTIEMIDKYGIPTPFLSLIMEEVFMDANPSKLRGATSGAAS